MVVKMIMRSMSGVDGFVAIVISEFLWELGYIFMLRETFAWTSSFRRLLEQGFP
jgi:hypothetical protein